MFDGMNFKSKSDLCFCFFAGSKSPAQPCQRSTTLDSLCLWTHLPEMNLGQWELRKSGGRTWKVEGLPICLACYVSVILYVWACCSLEVIREIV